MYLKKVKSNSYRVFNNKKLLNTTIVLLYHCRYFTF